MVEPKDIHKVVKVMMESNLKGIQLAISPCVLGQLISRASELGYHEGYNDCVDDGDGAVKYEETDHAS